MSLRLAVATEDFSFSLRMAIGLAAETGAVGVRLNARSELNAKDVSASSLRQILLYVRERSMQVAGLLCPARHGIYHPDYLEQRLELIARSMELVRPLGCTELIVRCGKIPDPDSVTKIPHPVIGIDDQPNPFSFAVSRPSVLGNSAGEYSLLCEILNDLTQRGNHLGCCLTLQLADFDGKMIRRLLSDVRQGPLKIVFDPATAVMTGARPETVFRDLSESIGYMRARDGHSGVDGAGIEVRVGDGQVNWQELIPMIAEAEFTGWVCVERTGGENRQGDAAFGVSYLKSFLPMTSS